MRTQQKWKAIAGLFLGVILLLGIYRAGNWLEEKAEKPETRGDYRSRYQYDTLMEAEGVSYRQKKNLTTVLLMGIDRPTSGKEGREFYRNQGQADFLRLIVVDPTERTISQIGIDRDTMTPIITMGILGDRSGERIAQISLSHSFGLTEEQGCELTKEAVSHLFMDVPIDFYFSIGLDAIPVLNDLVGGVTMTLEEDFSEQDPSMTPGTTLTLKGKQAEIYVRARHGVAEETNESRMARQEKYMSSLMEKIGAMQRQDQQFSGELYDAMVPYMATNIGRGRFINEVWLNKDYERMPVFHLEGEHVIGSDGFMQFYADQNDIQQKVLELFYDPVQ